MPARIALAGLQISTATMLALLQRFAVHQLMHSTSELMHAAE